MKPGRCRLSSWTGVSDDVNSDVSLAADQNISRRISVSLKFPEGAWWWQRLGYEQ
jgi:hypothetical protein